MGAAREKSSDDDRAGRVHHKEDYILPDYCIQAWNMVAAR
jgi:hypothetical protein